MKQHIELIKNILENGYEHVDRTGHGRITVLAPQMRFNLQEGFPITTARKGMFKHLVRENMWFLKGQTDNRILNEQKVHIWDKWAVKESDILAFYERVKKSYDAALEKAKEFDTQGQNEAHVAQALQVIRSQLDSKLGSIGNLYGKAWRSVPKDYSQSMELLVTPSRVVYDKLLSDKKSLVDANLALMGKTVNDLDNETLMSVLMNTEGALDYDQIAEVLNNLRVRPYSSRHVVSAWIPEWVASEDFTPEENVLMGNGALTACHCMFQFFVAPPKSEGGKKRLSCHVYIRSSDVPVGAPANITQYALITHMFAHVLGMDVNELIYTAGDAHLYTNQVEGAKEHITRTPRKLPTLKINRVVTDILDFKDEDFELVGYDYDERQIDYPVAK